MYCTYMGCRRGALIAYRLKISHSLTSDAIPSCTARGKKSRARSSTYNLEIRIQTTQRQQSDMSDEGAPADPTGSSPTEPLKSKKRKSNAPEIEVDLSAPEPPSKRARRALKKGKPLPTKPSGSGDGDED